MTEDQMMFEQMLKFALLTKKQADRISTLECAMYHEIGAARLANPGSTHWEGCELHHKDCAMIRRLQLALHGVV